MGMCVRTLRINYFYGYLERVISDCRFYYGYFERVRSIDTTEKIRLYPWEAITRGKKHGTNTDGLDWGINMRRTQLNSV